MTLRHSIDPPPAAGLRIRVSRGTGTGRTRLSAFDAALRDAGVADFNLIRLSSVIPPGSTVGVVEGADQLAGAHGDVLFCVYADGYASVPGTSAWAGVAWSERDDGSGAGLFVEHHAQTESELLRELEFSLEDLSQGRGGVYHPAGRLVTSRHCEEASHACALVVASYATAGWDGDATVGSDGDRG